MDTTIPLSVHPLADKTKPWIRIRFNHTDDTVHSFYSYINEMTGDRLSGFDGAAPTINSPVSWIRTVIRDIHKKATKVEMIGTIKSAK